MRAAALLVNIDVDNLGEGERFYCAAFGLHVGRRFDGAVELLGSDVPLYLLAKPAGTQFSPVAAQTRDYRRHWTPVHLDFLVDELEAAVERAKQAGASLEQDIAIHTWGRIALLADPFGNGFCLLQFVGRGYDEIADSV